MAVYTEFEYYSLAADGPVTRLSIFAPHRGVYAAVVPSCEGREWRETKAVVLDALVDAIEANAPPGLLTIAPAEISRRRRALERVDTGAAA